MTTSSSSSTITIATVAKHSPFGAIATSDSTTPYCWLALLIPPLTPTAADGGSNRSIKPTLTSSTLIDDPSPEPNPQTPEPLITAWGRDHPESGPVQQSSVASFHSPKLLDTAKSKSSRRQLPALVRAHASTPPLVDASGRRGGSPSTMNSSYRSSGGMTEPSGQSVSKQLSKRAIAAQAQRAATLREQQFWANRLRLLRRDVEDAEKQVASSSMNVSKQHTALMEDAMRQQLREEQEREAATRQERLAANKQQREAHAKALRDAHKANLATKRSLCQTRRNECAEATVFVEEQHNKELHRRTLIKESVQQEKVVQLLTRARVRALKAEETKRLYELRIEQLETEDSMMQSATAKIIQESSKYVHRMRQLKDEQIRLEEEAQHLHGSTTTV